MIEIKQVPLNAALNYAENGFPVFPVCWPGLDGKCGCGRNHEEKSVGKVPLTKNGLKDATLDPARISAFWKVHPQANVAIAIPSGYFVLDIDITHNGYESLSKLQETVGELPNTLLVTTGSGGSHYWFTTETPIRNTVNLAGYEGIDIRGIGGYCVTAPSLHRIGKNYAIANNVLIAPAPQALIDIVQKAIPQTQVDSPVVDAIVEGGRNHTLASLGGTMRRRGMTQEEIEISLTAINQRRCQPPLPEESIRKIAASVSRYSPSAVPNGSSYSNTSLYSDSRNSSHSGTNATDIATVNATLASRIDEWIKETKGRWFETQELDRDLGITQGADKDNRRVHLLRLEEKNIIFRHEKENRKWRYVSQELSELNYKDIPVVKPLDIILPLGLSRLVNLFPGNLAVLAGAPNAGKTALALEIIRLNNNGSMQIYYWYSEGGDIELRNRLDGCEGMDVSEWNFRAFSRATDFADVIVPGAMNIVDYLEVTNEFYSVADKLVAICDKNPDGASFVCLQKNAGARFGRGGSFSNEKARLYLSLDEADGASNCKITIEKGKSWAIKNYNPNHLTTTFHINNGWIRSNEVDWKYEPREQ